MVGQQSEVGLDFPGGYLPSRNFSWDGSYLHPGWLVVLFEFCYQTDVLGLGPIFQLSGPMTEAGLGPIDVSHFCRLVLTVSSLHQDGGGSLPAGLDGFLPP